MSAFLDSCQASGIQTQENTWNADAAVIWSVLWNGRMRPNQAVYEHYRSQNRPVIIIEVGALYRGETWKVAVNHITNAGYYGHRENLDPGRPARLRISLAQQPTTRPEIVIAAQHQRSLQVANLDSQESWILNQIHQLRTVTDRPIHVRPHPRSPLRLTHLPYNVVVEQPRPVPSTYDGFDMHYNCHAVVNYNSGPGIQAAISGCRPIVDASSLAAPVSSSLADIEHPYHIDRQQWLIEICHTEYTVQELQQGLWLKRIQSELTQ